MMITKLYLFSPGPKAAGFLYFCNLDNMTKCSRSSRLDFLCFAKHQTLCGGLGIILKYCFNVFESVWIHWLFSAIQEHTHMRTQTALEDNQSIWRKKFTLLWVISATLFTHKNLLEGIIKHIKVQWLSCAPPSQAPQQILQFIFSFWSVSSRSCNKIQYMKTETFQGKYCLIFSFRSWFFSAELLIYFMESFNPLSISKWLP